MLDEISAFCCEIQTLVEFPFPDKSTVNQLILCSFTGSTVQPFPNGSSKVRSYWQRNKENWQKLGSFNRGGLGNPILQKGPEEKCG